MTGLGVSQVQTTLMMFNSLRLSALTLLFIRTYSIDSTFGRKIIGDAVHHLHKTENDSVDDQHAGTDGVDDDNYENVDDAEGQDYGAERHHHSNDSEDTASNDAAMAMAAAPTNNTAKKDDSRGEESNGDADEDSSDNDSSDDSSSNDKPSGTIVSSAIRGNVEKYNSVGERILTRGGKQLSPYEIARHERVKRNEEWLRSSGLHGQTTRKRQVVKKKKKKTKTSGPKLPPRSPTKRSRKATTMLTTDRDGNQIERMAGLNSKDDIDGMDDDSEGSEEVEEEEEVTDDRDGKDGKAKDDDEEFSVSETSNDNDEEEELEDNRNMKASRSNRRRRGVQKTQLRKRKSNDDMDDVVANNNNKRQKNSKSESKEGPVGQAPARVYCEPSENDILIRPNRISTEMITTGYLFFTDLAFKEAPDYRRKSNFEKSRTISRVIDNIRDSGGKFLSEEVSTGRWYQATDETVYNKVKKRILRASEREGLRSLTSKETKETKEKKNADIKAALLSVVDPDPEDIELSDDPVSTEETIKSPTTHLRSIRGHLIHTIVVDLVRKYAQRAGISSSANGRYISKVEVCQSLVDWKFGDCTNLKKGHNSRLDEWKKFWAEKPASVDDLGLVGDGSELAAIRKKPIASMDKFAIQAYMHHAGARYRGKTKDELCELLLAWKKGAMQQNSGSEVDGLTSNNAIGIIGIMETALLSKDPDPSDIGLSEDPVDVSCHGARHGKTLLKSICGQPIDRITIRQVREYARRALLGTLQQISEQTKRSKREICLLLIAWKESKES